MKINYTYMMRYSVIIPVYNRPDEVDELLQSLTAQHFKDFEVVVVEDGSSVPCEKIVNQYQGKVGYTLLQQTELRSRTNP